MKTIENLLTEYKIRFRDTEVIKKEGYPFGAENYDEKGNFDPSIVLSGVSWIRNKYGVVCKKIAGDSWRWATADLKEKPIGWVVDLDKEHPKYNDFIKWYKDKAETSKRYMFNGRYQSSHSQSDCIFDFKSGQLITLDQWAEFFLPKVDFGIINDTDVFYLKSGMDEYLFSGGNPVTTIVKGYDVKYRHKFANRICFKFEVDMLRKADDKEKEYYYSLYPELAPSKLGDWGITYDDELLEEMLEDISNGIIILKQVTQGNTSRTYDNFHKIYITKNVKEQIDNFLKLKEDD